MVEIHHMQFKKGVIEITFRPRCFGHELSQDLDLERRGVTLSQLKNYDLKS